MEILGVSDFGIERPVLLGFGEWAEAQVQDLFKSDSFLPSFSQQSLRCSDLPCFLPLSIR